LEFLDTIMAQPRDGRSEPRRTILQPALHLRASTAPPRG